MRGKIRAAGRSGFMHPPEASRVFKILAIITFFLVLCMAGLIIQGGAAHFYEFSLYEAYPWYFWAIVLSAITCGQVIILGSALMQFRNRSWLFGLGAILLTNALLLLFPVIRAYYSYDEGDVLTHIGYMKDIIISGSIGGNHYPIDHILGVIINLFSGLPLPEITMVVPVFFSFFLFLSLYCIGRAVFDDPFAVAVLAVLATILMFKTNHHYFTPNAQALFLVPMMIYLAFRWYQGVNSSEYNLLLLLMCFLIVFYHPLVTVMVILLLAVLQVIQTVVRRHEARTRKQVNFTYNIFFIILVFSLWSTYLSLATKTAEPIIKRIFFGEASQSELMRDVNVLSQVNIDIGYLVRLILNIYGQGIILGLLALSCTLLILYLRRRGLIRLSFYQGVCILGFFAFSVLSVAMLVLNGSFGFERIYSLTMFFPILLTPACAVYGVYTLSPDRSVTAGRILKVIGICAVVFCITWFSVFNLYHSSLTKYTNQQVLKSDYDGMSTFFQYRDASLAIQEVGEISYRFDNAIYGYNNSQLHIFDDEPYMIPPDHFGYRNDTLAAAFFEDSKYLLLNERGRGLNPHINPEFSDKWSFAPEDFERVRSDPRLDLVYTNRNLEIFVHQVPPSPY